MFNEKAELAKAQEALKNKYGGMTPQQLESQLSKGTPPLGSASPKAPPLQTKPSVPEAAKLSPEVQGHLEGAVKSEGVKMAFVDPSDSSNPFAQRLGGGKIATIDRDTGQVLIDPKALDEYVKDAPPAAKGLAVRSVVAEEKNHLHVEDADAIKFAKTKTAAERKIIEHRYGQTGMSDLMLGHEAINFELQRLARMTPHQVLTAARGEKWKLRTMQMLETVIQNIRRAIGTKMSVEGDAILAKIQENLEVGPHGQEQPRQGRHGRQSSCRKGRRQAGVHGRHVHPVR